MSVLLAEIVPVRVINHVPIFLLKAEGHWSFKAAVSAEIIVWVLAVDHQTKLRLCPGCVSFRVDICLQLWPEKYTYFYIYFYSLCLRKAESKTSLSAFFPQKMKQLCGCQNGHMHTHGIIRIWQPWKWWILNLYSESELKKFCTC